MSAVGDVILNWYQRHLGNKAELLRPGGDEWSAYIKLDIQGGQDVLALFYIPRGVDEFVSYLRSRMRRQEIKETYVDYIDAWVPGKWVEDLQFSLSQLVDAGEVELANVRVRDASDLRIPIEVLEELEAEAHEVYVKTEQTTRSPRVRVGQQDLAPITRRATTRSLTAITEESLEVILERVLRRLEKERRLNSMERTVDDLQKRITVLEDFIRFLLSSRIPTGPATQVPATHRSVGVEIEEKEPKMGRGVEDLSKMAARAPEEERPMRKGEEMGSARRGEEIRPSRALFEEFVKDNPWGRVLRDKKRK